VTILLHSLPPGMEHSEESDLGAEVSGISGDLQQCFGSSLEEQAVKDPFVLQGQRAEPVWQRKHDVEILHRKKIRSALVKPFGARCGLTFWTMTIPAGVVSDLRVTALVASLQMPAQRGGATLHDVAQDSALLRREGQPVAFQLIRIKTPEDVRHFEQRLGFV
jgi:hypothetical protein